MAPRTVLVIWQILMAFNYRKSVTYRLVQAARLYRSRTGAALSYISLHPGQDALLKALQENDGQLMGDLAETLGVQPPTVTKMIARLSAQGFVRREVSEQDRRSARIYITELGSEKVDAIDSTWRSIEKLALKGLDDKERRRLRKLLKSVEANLLKEDN